MSHRKQLLCLTGVLILELIISFFIRKYAIILDLCETGYTNGATSEIVRCSYVKGENFITLLDLFSLILLPIFLVLFFCKQAVYKAWIRFACIAFPLLVLLTLPFFGSDGSSNGFMSPAFFSIDGEYIAFFFVVLFLFISLLIIIIKSLSLAGKTEDSKSKK